MKTKIVITNIVDFVFGIVMLSMTLLDLFDFCITYDIDKLTLAFLNSALGIRYIRDSVDKFYFKVKEENGNKCCANCSYAEFTGIGCPGKIEVICTKNKVLPIIEEPGKHKCEYWKLGSGKVLL